MRRQGVGLPVVPCAGLREHLGRHARNVFNIYQREPGVACRQKDAVPAHQFSVERAGEVLHEVGRPQQCVRHAASNKSLFDLVVRDEPIALCSLNRQENDVRNAVLPRPRNEVTEVFGQARRAQQKETVAVGQRSVLAGGVEVVEGHQLQARIAPPFLGRLRDIAHPCANEVAAKGE